MIRQYRFFPQFCAVGIVLLLLLALWISQPNPINSVTLSNRAETLAPVRIKLPYSAASNPKYKFALYKVSINYEDNAPAKWRIIGDDCIRSISIDDHPVNLASATGNVCDYHDGIIIDLSPYFHNGINTAAVIVEDTGGKYAFDIRPLRPIELLTPLSQQLFYDFIAITLILCACHLLWLQKVDYFSIGLFTFAAIISLHYLHVSNNDAETNDVGWHLDYIHYISQHWLKPFGFSNQLGIESTHPPLYYYIASAIALLNQRLLGVPYKTVLRFLSWTFFLVFNGFNLLTLRRSKFSKLGYYSCAALLLLWPGNDHLASKINSEALYYAFAAASFYYAIVWWEERKQANLIKAFIVAGFAVLTRGNAIILFSLIGILVLCPPLRRKLLIREFFTKKWVMAAMVLLLFVASMGSTVFIGRSILNGAATNYPLPPLTHYLSIHYSFDYPFLSVPGWQPQVIDFNKYGFFEYQLKSSMFGEYSWSSPEWAIPMNYLLVAIVWYSLLPWLFAKREYWRRILPYATYLAISQLFLISFSMIVMPPHWSSQDARYIYPALICLVVLFGQSQTYFQKRKAFLFSRLGPLLVIGFISLSTYFFWNNFR